MTEVEWLACTDPQEMLGSLAGKTTDRKLRLFAVACCRRVEQFLSDEPGCREAIARAEQCADGPNFGPAPCSELVVAVAACTAAFAAAAPSDDAAGFAAHAAYASSCLLGTGYADDAVLVWSVAADASAAAEHFDAMELACQAGLLRHIVGNPFRPQSPPLHVAANVRNSAEAVYQQERTAINPLNDALLDAGLGELAGHFANERGRHPKGCWALDILTGRT